MQQGRRMMRERESEREREQRGWEGDPDPGPPGLLFSAARRLAPEGGYKDAEQIDVDGLPHVGAAIWPGQSYYNAKDKLTGG